MDLVTKLSGVIERPNRLIIGIQIHIAHLFDNQALLISSLYRLGTGKRLNLKSPRTFTEKIQWLKLHDHNELYHSLVDKYAVKGFVRDKIGEEYVIPSYGVWDTFDDIDFDDLPNKFVLKTTNGGGGSGVVICRDKVSFSKESAKKLLEKSMKYDIYEKSGEWAYKGLKPRVLAEQFVEQDSMLDLNDYKWFCFDGEPKYCQVITNRTKQETIDFFDPFWNHQEFIGLNPNAIHSKEPIPKPDSLDKMIWIARTLSSGISFCRIDLYEINKKVLFGEITFYPLSGFGFFYPSNYDYLLGDMLKLPGAQY